MPMHSFIVSALAISCGRKYFPLIEQLTDLVDRRKQLSVQKLLWGNCQPPALFSSNPLRFCVFPLAPPLAPALPPAAVVFLYPLLSAGSRRPGLPYFPAGLPSSAAFRCLQALPKQRFLFGIRLFPTFLCLTGKFDITDITVFFI